VQNFLILIPIVVVLFCTQNISTGNGGTTEVTNAKVLGVVYSDDNNVLSVEGGADIRLYRLRNSLQPELLPAYRVKANIDGSFAIDSVDTGSYNLISFGNHRNNGIIQNILITNVDSVITVSDTLLPFGTISGSVSHDGHPTVSGLSCFVAGSPFATTTDTSGTFVLDSMPQDSVPLTIVYNYSPVDTARFIVKAQPAISLWLPSINKSTVPGFDWKFVDNPPKYSVTVAINEQIMFAISDTIVAETGLRVVEYAIDWDGDAVIDSISTAPIRYIATYPEVGTYQMHGRVKDASGAAQYISLMLYVKTLPIISADIANTVIATDGTIIIRGSLKGTGSSNRIRRWEWDPGMTGVFRTIPTANDSTATDTAFGPFAAGTVPCVLKATDTLGRIGYDTIDVSVIDTAQSMWLRVTSTTEPPPLQRISMTYLDNSDYLVATNGIELLYYNCRSYRWQTQLLPFYNEKREGMVVTHDSNSGSTVMFGGFPAYDETWVLSTDKGELASVMPAIRPLGRYNQGMVYDDNNRVVVMFGGVTRTTDDVSLPLRDTWVFDVVNRTWRALTATGPKGGYVNGSMVFNSASGKVILFGGNEGPTFLESNNSNELWELNVKNDSWARSALQGSLQPSPRRGALIGYDPNRNILLLFGGENENGILSDTWEFLFATATWKQISDGAKVKPRVLGAMAYDHYNKRFQVFGGISKRFMYPDTNRMFAQLIAETMVYIAGR